MHLGFIPARQCVAAFCSMLPCVALCSVLHVFTGRYIFGLIRRDAACCSVLQCVAVIRRSLHIWVGSQPFCCSVLRYVAVCCRALHCVSVCCIFQRVAVCYSVLQLVQLFDSRPGSCCNIL